jgi:hypothetical protein
VTLRIPGLGVQLNGGGKGVGPILLDTGSTRMYRIALEICLCC